MSEDFQRRQSNTIEAQLQCTFKSINGYLESIGRSVDKYDIPQIKQHLQQPEPHECREIIEEMPIKFAVEAVDTKSNLIQEQAQIYNTILGRVNSGTPRLFFVDGPLGTRKTFLYRALLAKVRTNGNIALASATSGVAATILPGDRTT